ncbi:MAG: hypothetical protein QG635_962, partial [Bacteroidota bacterium]|nr:hypothetical protein [Bacteroidota bacterium]
ELKELDTPAAERYGLKVFNGRNIALNGSEEHKDNGKVLSGEELKPVQRGANQTPFVRKLMD